LKASPIREAAAKKAAHHISAAEGSSNAQSGAPENEKAAVASFRIKRPSYLVWRIDNNNVTTTNGY
jgi:hypothetical protein